MSGNPFFVWLHTEVVAEEFVELLLKNIVVVLRFRSVLGGSEIVAVALKVTTRSRARDARCAIGAYRASA